MRSWVADGAQLHEGPEEPRCGIASTDPRGSAELRASLKLDQHGGGRAVARRAPTGNGEEHRGGKDAGTGLVGLLHTVGCSSGVWPHGGTRQAGPWRSPRTGPLLFVTSSGWSRPAQASSPGPRQEAGRFAGEGRGHEVMLGDAVVAENSRWESVPLALGGGGLHTG